MSQVYPSCKKILFYNYNLRTCTNTHKVANLQVYTWQGRNIRELAKLHTKSQHLCTCKNTWEFTIVANLQIYLESRNSCIIIFDHIEPGRFDLNTNNWWIKQLLEGLSKKLNWIRKNCRIQTWIVEFEQLSRNYWRHFIRINVELAPFEQLSNWHK